ncbi:polysaccharide deacetylase family protein [Streptomyces orinoci]|uniref:Polysaccharide deacetylase family protein n=1 Tax=Streptomyces orinoci TaxID=67339 RepID=A0ABV3K9D2_STRON|nr:polysaccharide deacetylase family protein [Streptomyces orinoci]
MRLVRTAAPAAALLVLLALGAPPATAAAEPWPYGTAVRSFPTARPEVALTFNAAWDEAGIPEVLRELGRRRTPATFFFTGDFADRHPGAVRTIARRYGIGNHSYSHPHFTGLPADRAVRELMTTDRALRRAAHTEPTPFFRFPYGETTPEGIALAASLGFADIEWTTDTKGYLGTAGGMTVARAVRRVAEVLAPGAIVQMHVGSADGSGEVLDARALPSILELIHDRGYQVVDLRGLLGRRPGRSMTGRHPPGD